MKVAIEEAQDQSNIEQAPVDQTASNEKQRRLDRRFRIENDMMRYFWFFDTVSSVINEYGESESVNVAAEQFYLENDDWCLFIRFNDRSFLVAFGDRAYFPPFGLAIST